MIKIKFNKVTYTVLVTLFDNKVMSNLYTLFYYSIFHVFFAFSSDVTLCLICFGPCHTNKVLLHFIHKVKFYKDKVKYAY